MSNVSDVHTSRLRVFLAVVDRGGFTAAAEHLHLTQQAVSAAVAKLEEELHVRLMERTTRSYGPTAVGAAFAEQARAIVAAWDSAVAAAHRRERLDRSVLRVGAMAGAALELTEPILAAFAALEPDASVELEPHLYDDPSAGLRSGSTDVAFLRPPLQDEDLVLTPLLVEPRVVIVGAGHPLAERGEVAMADLAAHTAARPAGPDETWNDFWSAGADPVRSIPVTTLESAFELVAAGRAFALAPVGWTRFYQRLGLQAVVSPDLPPSPLAIARRARERSPLVHRFVEAAVAVAGEQLALVPAAAPPAG
ncbi:LysR family transcriptional regulator [Patulibacter defluvii]|uniref:LysR family transcriptional regulator n=1 Tax=Patulibacter defluvii TaxID=3095358 RepID=UPI002A749150|nr:LysR family transcriptional regulator [Patulibacter sp. DM4]